MSLDRVAFEPGRWLTEASVLRSAGDAVFESAELAQRELLMHRRHPGDDRLFTHFAATMLWGYSLENLLKGLLVVADPGRAVRRDGDTIETSWGKGSGHNLCRLADQVEERFDQQNRALMSRMSSLTTWGGRYAIPRRLDDWASEGDDRGSKSWTSTDTATFERLYGRLHARLENADAGLSREVEHAQQECRSYRSGQRLAELHGRCRQRSEDSRTLFEDTAVHDQERSCVVCLCNAQHVFEGQIVAVLCSCGSLFDSRWAWDPSRGRVSRFVDQLDPVRPSDTWVDPSPGLGRDDS
jgi:hypothetical protein